VFVPRWGDADRERIALAQLSATPDVWADWEGERIALAPHPIVLAFAELADHAERAARGYPPPTVSEVAAHRGVTPRTVKRWQAQLRERGGPGAVEVAWSAAVEAARAEVAEIVPACLDALASSLAEVALEARAALDAAQASPGWWGRALDAGGWLRAEREVGVRCGRTWADGLRFEGVAAYSVTVRGGP
jgi:transposase-like protein